MGDRANIVIRDQYTPAEATHEAVFLYSHWGGTGMPEVLRQALANGRGRWDDEAYLARIVFDTMVGEEQGGETGYGISTRMCDNEYDLLVLADGHVYRVPEGLWRERGVAVFPECESIDFEAYVAADSRDWDNLTAEITT